MGVRLSGSLLEGGRWRREHAANLSSSGSRGLFFMILPFGLHQRKTLMTQQVLLWVENKTNMPLGWLLNLFFLSRQVETVTTSLTMLTRPFEKQETRTLFVVFFFALFSTGDPIAASSSELEHGSDFCSHYWFLFIATRDGDFALYFVHSECS